MNMGEACCSTAIEELCRTGELMCLLERYLQHDPNGEKSVRRFGEALPAAERKKTAYFPNLAGFCRYLGVGVSQFERAMAAYPEEYGILRAVLEDEALNSGIGTTVLSAYLKERLGYGREEVPESAVYRGEQIRLVFEHDMAKDGA